MNDQAAGIGGAGLTPQELAALRENLEEQRRFRLDQLREFARSRAGSRHGRHGGRRTAGLAEVDAKLRASARMVLADVEAALERMDRGRYGVCHLCARPIPLHHLEVVPQARYCARCQQVGEAGR